jgi:putative aldouronate transport system permease protein
MATTTATPKLRPAAGAGANRETLWRRIVAARTLFWMFLLPFLLILVFEYGAMYGLVIAFKDYNLGQGIWGSEWVGLKHFRDFFDTPFAMRAPKNTLIISLGTSSA